MRSSKPPVLASWLIEHLIPGVKKDALAGDLLEQFSQGRSAAWYWRQALVAVLVSFSLTKTWWLLALCGVLDGMHAAMNLLMLDTDGSLALRRFVWGVHAVRDMGVLALAAGACAIAAGLWSSGRGNSWFLSLHGLALGAFGLIAVSPLVRGPLRFRPVSLLFVVMAVSLGTFALEAARTLRSDSQERWFLNVAGATSIGFAFSFFAVGFGWIRLGTPHFFIWMSSYFSFCSTFMLWLAMRVHSQGLSQTDKSKALPPLRSPRHVH